MASSIFYLACVLGIATAALYLLVRPGPRALKLGATVVGLGALGWLVQQFVGMLGGDDPSDRPGVIFFIFSLIAVASAVRMITHSRPIYSALYFVMVVLSSAGLFLLLEAEFMAFALIIVYAGAILITYLFVLMLAQQAPGEDGTVQSPEYDRIPREPAAGVAVGFVMLALLSEMIFSSVSTELQEPPVAAAEVAAWRELEQMPGRLRRELIRVDPDLEESFPADQTPAQFSRIDEQGGIFTVGPLELSGQTYEVSLPHSAMPQNIQRVGWALVHQYPASLELAGVILLMAMFGSVVLAQRQIELSEQEKLEAARAQQSAHDAANGGGA